MSSKFQYPLEMPVPLRPNFTAHMVIPRDITNDEVERLYRVLKTLIQEDAPCEQCGGNPCDCHYDRPSTGGDAP